MELNDLAPDLQEKAKACKTPEELMALAEEEGIELSDEQLAGASGGVPPHCKGLCPAQGCCPAATDLRGHRCTSYRFQ